MLEKLDIPVVKLSEYHTNTGKPYYRINISISKEKVEVFRELVGFSIKRKKNIVDKILSTYRG